MFKRINLLRGGLFAVVLSAFALGFHLLLLDHAPNAFRSPEEDMSFAWFVPIYSLYVLWVERDRIRASVSKPSFWGVLGALPCFVLGFLGARGAQVRFEIVGLVGLFLTSTWVFFGRRTAKQVLFPCLFLLFCIPLATFLDVITVHLRLLATGTAYAILKGFGSSLVRQGTMIFSPDGSFGIDVAAPCSGLRSIFALMALTAGYAYFNQPTWLRRGILFLLSIPVAIAGNVMRILSICFVGSCASPEFATGFYHDYSGYIVFVVAILLILACSALIQHIAQRLSPNACDASSSTAAVEGSLTRGSLVLIVSFAVCAVAFMIYQARSPRVTLAEAPQVELPEVAGCTWVAAEPTEAEREVLPSDTIILKRVYTDVYGVNYNVTAVVGGASKSSIHRPELCLPAQGFQMSEKSYVTDGTGEWHLMRLDREAYNTYFAYTFFNQTGYRTASHVARIFRDVCDRSFLSRIDRWVMITVHAGTVRKERVLSFLDALKGMME